MENDINRLMDEVRRLSARLENVERIVTNNDRKTDTLIRETGADNGQELSYIINDLMNIVRRQENQLSNIERNVENVRRLVESSDNGMNEIRQALGAIYRNTDELEDMVIPGQRRTT